MTKPAIALCAALAFDGETAPDWLHLLPAGAVRTRDGRGPYRVPDAAALMAASLGPSGKLVLDENHATDLAAPKGGSAPARGWIVELQARVDGIWGRVEWTSEGRRLAEDKAYRGVSPVIAHRKDGTITAILRASLTNQPNLTGLQSLHQEEDMDLRMKLIGALGLDSEADDAAILAAISKRAAADTGTALQAALSPIAKAAGLAEDADATAVLAGVQQLAEKGAEAVSNDTVTALQSELVEVTKKLNALTDTSSRKAAETFVDAAILAGHVGVKAMRDRYVAMHMKDAAQAEELIGALPRVKGGAIVTGDPPRKEAGELSAADRQVIALMGLDPEAYKSTLAAEATSEEML